MIDCEAIKNENVASIGPYNLIPLSEPEKKETNLNSP